MKFHVMKYMSDYTNLLSVCGKGDSTNVDIPNSLSLQYILLVSGTEPWLTTLYILDSQWSKFKSFAAWIS